MTKFIYHRCCVDFSMAEVGDLQAMIDAARPITLRTFRRHCDTAAWERQMGYERGGQQRHKRLSLTHDWHVRYYRSRFRGRPCYYAVHSAIEYIFLPSEG